MLDPAEHSIVSPRISWSHCPDSCNCGIVEIAVFHWECLTIISVVCSTINFCIGLYSTNVCINTRHSRMVLFFIHIYCCIWI